MYINKLTQREYKKMLIVCFIILSAIPYITGLRVLNNTGYNFFNFIFIYMFGAYFRMFPLKESYHFKNMSINGYRLFMIMIFSTMFFGNYLINNFASQIIGMSNVYSEIASRVLTTKFLYSTPFVIIQTIAYFELFNTFKFQNRVINMISSGTFGVYLFHENPIIREHLYRLLHLTYKYIISYSSFVWVLICVVLIFAIGIIIELFRLNLRKLILKIPLNKKFILKLRKYIDSFNFKINW